MSCNKKIFLHRGAIEPFTIIGLALIMIALPVVTRLVQQRQETRIKAAICSGCKPNMEGCTWETNPNGTCHRECRNGQCVTVENPSGTCDCENNNQCEENDPQGVCKLTCTPNIWDPINCRRCNPYGSAWSNNCSDYGNGNDANWNNLLWDRCACKCEGKNCPSCAGLTVNGPTTINAVQSVNLVANVSGYGIIRYGKVSDCSKRLIDSPNPQTLASGNNSFTATFTPPDSSETSYYVFEVNAYENNECHLLCAPSGNLYKNEQGIGGCDTRGHWVTLGSCTSNNCSKCITVLPLPSTPTPTSTATSTVTPISTNTPTPTPTPTPTSVSTPTPTSRPTATSTPTSTPTPTPTPTPTSIPTPTPLSCVPSIPSGLSGTCDSSGNSATVSWNSVSGATKYALRVNDTTTGGWNDSCNASQGDFCLDLTATSYTFNTVPGDTYVWWVHAINNCGWSNPASLSFVCPYSCNFQFEVR